MTLQCHQRCVCCDDVAVPPAQPDDAEVVEDTPTTVMIEVTPSDDDGGVPIIGYTVSFDTTTARYNLGT